MYWVRRTWIMLAALSGALGVMAGAYGAHGVADPLARHWLEIGAEYQMIHALTAVVSVSVTNRRSPLAPALFIAGTVLFSGTLYGMALGAPHWLGAVTPMGGLLFLAGWAALAWEARKIDRSPG